VYPRPENDVLSVMTSCDKLSWRMAPCHWFSRIVQSGLSSMCGVKFFHRWPAVNGATWTD